MASQLSLEDQWKSFKETHKREFNDEEEKMRFALFQETVRVVEKHNKKYEAGETSYTMGINLFADRTPEERKMYLGCLPPKA